MTTQRERILAKALFLKKQELYVEEWEETVYIQELTGQQLVDFTTGTYKMVDGQNQADPITAMVNILFYCLVDEEGNRLFNKSQLRSLPGVILLRLGGKALKFNGLDNKDRLGDLGNELKKTQVDDSSSD